MPEAGNNSPRKEEFTKMVPIGEQLPEMREQTLTDKDATDTPDAIPESQEPLAYDPARRGTDKIQGESVPTTGDERERRPETDHL